MTWPGHSYFDGASTPKRLALGTGSPTWQGLNMNQKMGQGDLDAEAKGRSGSTRPRASSCGMEGPEQRTGPAILHLETLNQLAEMASA